MRPGRTARPSRCAPAKRAVRGTPSPPSGPPGRRRLRWGRGRSAGRGARVGWRRGRAARGSVGGGCVPRWDRSGGRGAWVGRRGGRLAAGLRGGGVVRRRSRSAAGGVGVGRRWGRAGRVSVGGECGARVGRRRDRAGCASVGVGLARVAADGCGVYWTRVAGRVWRRGLPGGVSIRAPWRGVCEVACRPGAAGGARGSPERAGGTRCLARRPPGAACGSGAPLGRVGREIPAAAKGGGRGPNPGPPAPRSEPAAAGLSCLAETYVSHHRALLAGRGRTRCRRAVPARRVAVLRR